MKIEPLGFYVLIEVELVPSLSPGGIELNKNEVAKDQEGKDFGTVLAIGPTAYASYTDCEAGGEAGAKKWGFGVGDKVEFRRYEGKLSNQPDVENYRYIPDSHIIGRISEGAA